MEKPEIICGMTAFLDILGFGERISAAETLDDIDAIAKNVRRIQTLFSYRSQELSIQELHRWSKKTVLAFSDSVIVNVPLESESTRVQGTFDPFMSEFVELAIAQAICVHEGLFLRGGIDLGWWYRDGDVLVSQGLVRAYKMEGLANVPVIALTEDLYRFFENHSDRNTYAEPIEPVASLFRKYNGESRGLPNGFWFLDYINIAVQNLGWAPKMEEREKYRKASSDQREEMRNNGCAEKLRDWFLQHAKMIENAYRAVNQKNVAEKYVWLSRYHNDIARNYGLENICLCKVAD